MSRKFAAPRDRPVIGPPQALISRIDHLHSLLRHLPSALPEDPSHSLYNFAVDPQRLEEGGHFAAAGHALEISFETALLAIRGQPLLFTERGRRHDALVKMLKVAVKNMSAGDRTAFQEAWIERLITAALDSGAKIPTKKRKVLAADTADTSGNNTVPPPPKKSRTSVIVLDHSDDEPQTVGSSVGTASSSTSPTTASSSSLTLPPTPRAPAPSRSSPDIVLGNPRQSTLNSFGWKKATPQDISSYWAKAKEDGAERREEVLKSQERTKEEKQQHERDLARLRQQRRRARKKAEKGEEDETPKSNANEVLLQGANTLAQSKSIPDMAALSRPDTQVWRKDRTGTLGGVVRGPAKRVFWFTPFLWAIIQPTILRCGWSAARTVNELQRAHPNLFNGLHRGTVWKWIVKGEKRFTDTVLRSISNRKSLGGTGRTGILTPYPDITAEIVTVLKGLRVSGCVVNVQIARSLMIAIITKHNPALLSSFSCSEKYVRMFLDSTLNWSSRKATRAAKHIPENASELCERTFFRLAHTIEHQHIPAKLIINYDQTGVYIRPNATQTFEVRGSKQVSVTGNDEKRAFTCGISTTADGTFLPIEQVWSGLTNSSLPTPKADGYQEAKDRGFHFTFAASKKRTSHFSTLKTMGEVFRYVFKPYIDSVITSDPDLDDDQKAIIFIDIYPVHTSLLFRTLVHEDFPNIILIFVPGNCTGIFQPQDVGIQRVAKHHLRQSQLEYLVRCHQEQLATGVTAENIKFSSSYPVLRDASVRACVDLYDWMTSPDGRRIVQRSWELCVVPDKPEYNLSYECLTSRETRKALRKYLEHDKILADEIRARVGPRTLADAPVDVGAEDIEITDGGNVPDSQQDQEEDDIEDDTDIPLPVVVDRVLRVRVQNAAGRYVAKSGIRAEGEDGLSAADAEEDIWAYNGQGQLWTEAGVSAADEESSEEDGEGSGDDYNSDDD